MSFFGQINIAADVPGPKSFDASATSSEMIAANTARKGLWIQNVSNKTGVLACGNAAEVDKGIRVVKNERVVMDSNLLPTQAINVITESGSSKKILYQEFV